MYPNVKQKDYFAKCFGCVRFIYNKMLEDKISYYHETNKQKRFTQGQYKNCYSFLKEIDSNALSNAQINVEKAFSNFFANKHFGYPKFKSRKDSKQSYTTTNNIKKNNVRIENGKIRLPIIGFVKINYHRRLPDNSIIKSATVTKNRDNTYYVSILLTYEIDVPIKHLDINKSIGLDYSNKHLFVDSQNNVANYPKFYSKSSEKLAREQKRLSNMKKGSSNYNKQKIIVAKRYRKVSNQRYDFLHKLSTKYAETFDIVSVESLDMTDISKSYNLGQSTMDNGYGMFHFMLKYKMEERGKSFIQINKYYPSSKKCNCCGFIKTDLSINEREWTCPECGEHHSRDLNASINIKKEGEKLFFYESNNNPGAQGLSSVFA